MKTTLLKRCIGLGLILSLVGGSVMAQMPTDGENILGYTGYSEDYVKKYNLFTVNLSSERPYPALLDSPFREYYTTYGEVIGGTWIKGEWCAISTNAMGEGYFTIYNPYSQTTRYVGRSAVACAAGTAFDMTYDPVTENIYVLYPTGTGSSYLQRLTPLGDTLWGLKTGNSILTIDGVQAPLKFRTIAANNRGELYTIYDDGGVFKVNTTTLEAERVMSIPSGAFRMGAFSSSATFASNPDVLYVMNYYQGYHVFRIDLKTQAVTKILNDIEPLVGLSYIDYGENNRYAAPLPVSNLKVYKNSTTEATLYFNLPATNILGNALKGRLEVELYRGEDDNSNEWEKIKTLSNLQPGSSETIDITSPDGTYYYALRVRNAEGGYSKSVGTFCSFYEAAIPFATSFEINDESGAVSTLGKGWKRQTNFNSFSAIDTVVRTGQFAYAIQNDTVSKLIIGAGLNIYAGVEYELSFYICGHGKIVYGNRWQHHLKQPLGLSVNGCDTTVNVPNPYISETPNPSGIKPWIYPNKDITKYTYAFTPTENRQLEVVFRALDDDSYYIDDLSVSYKGVIHVPAVPDGPAVNTETSNPEQGRMGLQLTTPSKTLSGNELTSMDGVVFEYSPYRGFRNEVGEAEIYFDTLKSVAAGTETSHILQVPFGGFWYVQAYAYNQYGRSPYTPALSVGYVGKKAELRMTVQNKQHQGINQADVWLEPLFTTGVEMPDLTGLSNENGLAVMNDLYGGRYRVCVAEFYHDTLSFVLNIRRDTALTVILTDRVFHRYPAEVKNLRSAQSKAAHAMKIQLNWQNPSLDADGLPLAGIHNLPAEAIDGVAFFYTADGENFIALDTLKAGATTGKELTPGAEASFELTFPKQGHFTLRAIAYNRHNTPTDFKAADLELGYVGSGFSPSFLCLSGAQAVSEVRITLVNTDGDTAYTATGNAEGRVTFQGVKGGTYNLYATADYYNRLIKESVEILSSDEQKLEGFVYTLSKPEITSLQVLGLNTVRLDWNVATSRHFKDGFESYTDFAIDNIGDYKLGGHKSKGTFGGVTWENMYEDQAFIVFNPSKTTPSLADDLYLNTRTGNKMLCSFFTVRNDDWLVHSVAGGGELKFWAAGPQLGGAGSERFMVLYSSGDDRFSSFIPLSDGVIETEKNWKEYTFELPDQARYFAIHCISDDASVLKIDDLSYTLRHGDKIAQAQAFEVYVDDLKVATVDASTSSYTFDKLPDGPRTLGLKAIYENGASEMVTRRVIVGKQIENPIGLAMHHVGRTYIFSYRMPSGSTADYFQIFLDGRHIKNTLALFDTLPTMTMNADHVAGVCAVFNNHFSDTITMAFRTSLANETLTEAGFDVYPNPSPDGWFKLCATQAGEAAILTTDGRKLYTFNFQPGTKEIDLSGYPKGVYLLDIRLRDGRHIAGKLVIP